VSAAAGYANFLRILDEGRIAIAALSVGAAQGCVDECVKYAKQREAFGAAIGTYQAVAFKIARMEARAHTARTPTTTRPHSCWRASRSRRPPRSPSSSPARPRWTTPETPPRLFGGYGFMNEYAVARHYRDSKILEIGEGTTEVQLMLIAREAGL
jgi:alkylation response protein AidB-like acyl-CoA dehydrogenase